MLFSKCQAKIEADASEVMFCGQGSPLSESYHCEHPHFTELFQKAQMPPCSIGHGVNFTFAWCESRKQRTSEMFMSIISYSGFACVTSVLLASALCADGKCLDGGGIGT